MKYLPLLLAVFKRHRLRTALTILSIVVAFVLFGYLSAIAAAFSRGVGLAGADRMVVRQRDSIINLLPAAHEAKIEAVPGVVDATPATWFGGIYQDPKNFFAQMPVKPAEWLRMYPEYLLPEAEKKAWLATRTGAIAGRSIADKYGWKIGDKIPIQATIWRPKTGGTTWTFDLVGIYDGAEKGTDTTQFFFRQDFFDENRAFGEGTVGWYIVRIADPAKAPQIARQIDATFANSPDETKSESEKAFVSGFAKQIGDIGAIATTILAAVFFTILMVAGNTMAQAVRERTGELAVLKALGFGDGRIVALVLAESCLVAGVGAAVGLALAWLGIGRGDPTGGVLPIFYFPRADLVLGVAFGLALGLATGLLPALSALRLDTVEALRRG